MQNQLRKIKNEAETGNTQTVVWFWGYAADLQVTDTMKNYQREESNGVEQKKPIRDQI